MKNKKIHLCPGNLVLNDSEFLSRDEILFEKLIKCRKLLKQSTEFNEKLKCKK